MFLNNIRILIESSNGIMLISTDDFSDYKQLELIDYFSCYLKVDGILVFSLKNPLKKAYDTPIVSLLSSADQKVDSVVDDYTLAMQNAVDLLNRYGHKNIAFLSEELTKRKATLFEQISLEKGLFNIKVFESDKRFEEAGKDCADKLINSYPECTAIICAYDNIAIGAIKQLKKHGYKIPDDISVIGMDNITVGEHTETSLTTIDSNPKKVCEIAWDLMQKKLKNPYFKNNEHIKISSTLIIRESVRNIK